MEELISGLMSMRGHVTKGAHRVFGFLLRFFFLGGGQAILLVGKGIWRFFFGEISPEKQPS